MNLKIVPSTFASDHKTGAKTELFAKTNTMLLKEDKDSRKNISINLQGYFLSIGFCCNFNSYRGKDLQFIFLERIIERNLLGNQLSFKIFL